MKGKKVMRKGGRRGKATSLSRRRRFGTVVEVTGRSGKHVWQARWFDRPGEKRQARNFATKKEAEHYLAERQKRVITGEFDLPDPNPPPPPFQPPHRAPTFTEYAKRVIEVHVRPVRAASTTLLYGHNLKNLRRYFGKRREADVRFDAARLDQITPASLLAYRSWRLTRARARGDEGTGVVGCNRELQFVSLVLHHAVKEGILHREALFNIGELKLKEPRAGRRWLNRDEAGRLIRATTGAFRAYVVASLTTGCRPQELKALRWQDIDFQGMRVHVYRRKVLKPDALPLHPLFGAELKALQARYPNRKADDRIFLNRHGKPWRDMRVAWEKALEAAGIPERPGLTLYSLRHTFSTHFLENGGAVSDLQAQLGHSSLSTTQIYASLVDERRRDSVLALSFLPAEEKATSGKIGASRGASGAEKVDGQVSEGGTEAA